MATPEATAASRDLLRARWGDQRVRSLVAELEQRVAELTDPALRARVAALAEPVESED